MDDLESGISLARTCCHHQEDAVLATGDSLDDPVDGDALIITRREAVAIAIVRNIQKLCAFLCEVGVLVHPLAMEFAKCQGCGEVIHAESAFRTCIHIVLNK